MYPATALEMARTIDQTNLRPEATSEEIADFVSESRKHGFRTVALMPSWVPLATEVLEGSDTSIVSSVGFPLGTVTTAAKVSEANWSIEHGREDIEIDMVMNLPLLRSRRYREVEEDIRAVVEAAEGHTVKVIIEVPLLNQDEIVIASMIAARAGVDFVKTSTGFKAFPGMRASTPEDVRLIRSIVGAQVDVKIAGGVFTLEQALRAVKAGASRIGTIAGIPIVESYRALAS